MFAGLTASLTVATTAFLIRASESAPAWLPWFGLAAAGALLFSFVYIPLFVLPIWTLIATLGIRNAGRPLLTDAITED